MYRRTNLILCLVIFLLSMNVQAVDLDPSKYDVYFGDFNGDGKANDIYVHGKDKIVLIHADIAIPILIAGPPGFAYYENKGGQAHALDVDRDQLSSYTLAIKNQNVSYADRDKNGFFDVVVTTAEGHQYTLRGDNTTTNPAAFIEYKRRTVFIHTDVLGSPVSESQ